MFLRKQFDKRSGIYRSSDSIENFKIRISLRTLNTLVKVPKFVTAKPDKNVQQDETDDEVETQTIQWQEKILSQKEIKFFGDKENCQTDAQKEYHQTIIRNGLDNDGRPFNKIFTYVSEDSFHPDDDEKKLIEFIERGGEVEEEDSNHLITSKGGGKRFFNEIFGFETMYVMADLAVETILFTIRWRSRDGLLIVYPDFNSLIINPYLQEIDSDTKHLFHYSMENLSDDFDNSEQQMKKEIEVVSQLKDLSITPPSIFHIPSRRCTNVLFLLEIESAERFEYDNIHVRFNVTLPNRCELLDGLIQGSTHSCRRATSLERINIGYCHELMLHCNTDYQWGDDMKILLDVISIDGWSRERSEGYTMLTIPFSPGIFHHKLLCYRELAENTFMDKLKRYFIGGRRIVDHKAFNGISTTNEVAKLNRYGNETISTGILFVKHQILVQRNDSLVKTSNVGNRMKNSAKHQITIDDVVSAYHLAKIRLEATASNK